MTAVLEIENLRIGFPDGTQAVRGLSLRIERGETHCLVGESGCGKSMTALAAIRLLPKSARWGADVMRFQDQDLLASSERGMAINEPQYTEWRCPLAVHRALFANFFAAC